MRVLLDTHVWLWWLRGDSRLSPRAAQILEDGRNELLWSMASSWEIAVKISIGKLRIDRPVHRLLAEVVSEQGAIVLPIGQEHCAELATLPLHHRDPFDRMLIAQARVAKVPLVTADAKFSTYDVDVAY